MESKSLRQTLLWGGLLTLAGVLLLVETVTDLGVWIWIALLVAGALVATGLYLADRSDWPMLLTAYILWAIALLVILVTLNILRDEAVAVYSVIAIALPFVSVFYRDRTQWWALIPAYVMLVVALMLALIGLGVLNDMLIPAYVLLAIALPFFVVYARDRSQWWPLIPGGILAVIGLSFLVAEGSFAIIGALVLFLIGAGMLVRVFTGKGSADKAGPPDPELPAANGPDSGAQAEGQAEQEIEAENR